MKKRKLTCFKTYDIRGEIDVNLDEDVAYRVGRATAQILNASDIVVGYDARQTSPLYAKNVSNGIMDTGCNVLMIGLAGTEEMYWAVSEFDACAGIMVTASHNPINYNGMKIVKSKAEPLNSKTDFGSIKKLASSGKWKSPSKSGKIITCVDEAREKYTERVLSFIEISKLRPLNIVINSGNGSAALAFDAIASKLKYLGAPLTFFCINHKPDSTFPNGIPNPVLKENHSATGDVVLQKKADLGVAFDGDFDRCCFFDEDGKFISAEKVVGLLVSVFLNREPGAFIVHDTRSVWSTVDTIKRNGGVPVAAKTGHVFLKEKMRETNAVYGGENSSHHYFRDFAFCDSGMIPWLIISELISTMNCSFGTLVQSVQNKFYSSGELNFKIKDANHAISQIVEVFGSNAHIDWFDGVSLSFPNWRLNLRKSNTEQFVRLNVEVCGNKKFLAARVNSVLSVLLK